MRQIISPKLACLVDAIGCAIGGTLLLLSPTIWSLLALPDSWRLPTGILLLVFSGIAIATFRLGSRQLFTAAVVGNVGWILAGFIALFYTDTTTGMVIIATVIIADAAMAWIQFPGTRM